MKVIIAAGGTGGHIYPALALADELKKEKPDSEIIFYGSEGRMEATAVPARGYRFIPLHIESTQGGMMQKVKSVLSMKEAENKTLDLLKKEKPDICVGFGNYISVPLITAASKLHIPTMIHEANSFAGRANRFLSSKADAVVTCYEDNEKQMSGANIRRLGNPQATLAAETVWNPQELKDCGLNPEKPFVLFMMGSLGSSSVSKIIEDAIPMFDSNYQILVAAGKSNEYQFKNNNRSNVKIVPYVNGRNMLKGCTLAVLRAGATTICEISAIGTPSILIPSPYVPSNHQYWNAHALTEKNAAVMIEEKDLTAAKLSNEVNTLMKDHERLHTMKKNAYAEGQSDAAVKMVEWMEELVND